MAVRARDKLGKYGGMVAVVLAQMLVVRGGPKDIALWLSPLARGVVLELGGEQVGGSVIDVVLQYVYFDGHRLSVSGRGLQQPSVL